MFFTSIKSDKIARGLLTYLLLFLLAGSCSKDDQVTSPNQPIKNNLVLITLDTLRSDHLSCYGYQTNTTKILDRFAGEGIRFKQTLSTAPWTCPSMASLFTSRYPESHGMVLHPIRDAKRFRSLSPDLTTIAEVMKKAGCETHALSEQAWVSSDFGFNQGFDTFRMLEGQDRILTEKALEHLEGFSKDRPFFLYLHFLDPHTPYTPPPEFEIQHPGKEKYDLSSLDWDGWWQRLWTLTRDTPDVDNFLSYVRSLYDGEIAYIDHQIGLILDRLEQLGLADNTMVAIVSDHGEAFLEHAMLHGSTLFNEELSVPMLIKVPWEAKYRGAVVEGPCSTLDLMPTLIHLLGLPAVKGMQGRVRLPGENLPANTLQFSENAYNLNLKKVQSRDFSLILDVQKPQECQFFNLEKDPYEQEDVLDLYPDDFTRMMKAMRGWLKEQARWEKPRSPEIDLSDEMQERLRGLGYLK